MLVLTSSAVRSVEHIPEAAAGQPEWINIPSKGMDPPTGQIPGNAEKVLEQIPAYGVDYSERGSCVLRSYQGTGCMVAKESERS